MDDKEYGIYSNMKQACDAMVDKYHNLELLGWEYSIEFDGVPQELPNWVIDELMK